MARAYVSHMTLIEDTAHARIVTLGPNNETSIESV
jgi:hypothetical protein